MIVGGTIDFHPVVVVAPCHKFSRICAMRRYSRFVFSIFLLFECLIYEIKRFVVVVVHASVDYCQIGGIEICNFVQIVVDIGNVTQKRWWRYFRIGTTQIFCIYG